MGLGDGTVSAIALLTFVTYVTLTKRDVQIATHPTAQPDGGELLGQLAHPLDSPAVQIGRAER